MIGITSAELRQKIKTILQAEEDWSFTNKEHGLEAWHLDTPEFCLNLFSHFGTDEFRVLGMTNRFSQVVDVDTFRKALENLIPVFVPIISIDKLKNLASNLSKSEGFDLHIGNMYCHKDADGPGSKLIIIESYIEPSEGDGRHLRSM